MKFRDGFASIDLAKAGAVAEAFVDRFHSDELDDSEIISPTVGLEFPVVNTIMTAVEAKLDALKTGDEHEDAVIDALIDGGAIVLAILVELAEVEMLEPPSGS